MDRRLPAIACALSLLSCAGTRPTDLGLHGSALSPCPSSPNCVSSDADDARHRIAPFELVVAPAEAWRAARLAVLALPRTRIVAESPDYLHAECSSAIFGFVDDLELHQRGSPGQIAVRSASRVGRGDLGVNRRRVEAIRARLVEQGVVR